MKSFTPGTKKYFLASLHAQGLSKNEAFALLRPKVISQSRPWIYTANVAGGPRTPKTISEQIIELRNDISRVWNAIEKMDSNPVSSDAYKVDETEIVEEQVEEIEEPKPIAQGKRKDAEKRFFVSEWKRIRSWIHTQAETFGNSPVDSLDSMRPIEGARRMIEAGISAKMCLYAMALHWSSASRQDAGISEQDFMSESEDMGNDSHKLAGYVLKLAQAAKGQGFGVMLIGPAGSGKSYLAEQVSKMIRTESHPDGLPYGETPMTPGATRGDLLGRMTASPDKEDRFVLSQFVEIYSGGGVFNFEEMDAADPSMLIVVNNALASGRLFNPVNGQVYLKHCDFIAFATANTFGLGANEKYTGREKLDLATIDRFRMARVLVDLDEELAERKMFS